MTMTTSDSLPGRDAAQTESATTVSGRLGTWAQADALRHTLLDDGFSPGDIEVFYTGPSGRHDATPIGGDSSADAGSTRIGEGAAEGGVAGAAIGFAIGAIVATAPLAGPVILTAAAVGALGGVVLGGVGASEDGSTMPDTPEHPVGRPGGVVFAVRTDLGADDEQRALRHLREAGAIGLERAPARWADGRWVDWDPVEPREQIAPAAGTPQA
jgi:hypothetical protein